MALAVADVSMCRFARLRKSPKTYHIAESIERIFQALWEKGEADIRAESTISRNSEEIVLTYRHLYSIYILTEQSDLVLSVPCNSGLSEASQEIWAKSDTGCGNIIIHYINMPSFIRILSFQLFESQIFSQQI